MNLRASETSRGRFGPRAPRLGLPDASEIPSGRCPFAIGPGGAPEPCALEDPAGRVAQRRRTPLPSQGGRGRSEGTGDRAVAWWRRGLPEAGGWRTPRGTHGPAIREKEPSSRNLGAPAPPSSGSRRRGTDRRTDQCFRCVSARRLVVGVGDSPLPCAPPPHPYRTLGKFPGAARGR